MDELYFREMTLEDKDQMLELIKEFIVSGSQTDGIMNEEIAQDYEDWLRLLSVDKNRKFIDYNQTERVPSEMLILVRKKDERIVGCFSFRYYLNKKLDESFGGNLGCSIRPSERRKGYATKGLTMALELFKSKGFKEIKMGCYADNTGSRKAIENNGGILIDSLDKMIRELYYKVKL